jgi:hypothetical protein
MTMNSVVFDCSSDAGSFIGNQRGRSSYEDAHVRRSWERAAVISFLLQFLFVFISAERRLTKSKC